MDAQYYNEKLLETLRCWRTCSWEDAIDILHQIAADARREQAEKDICKLKAYARKIQMPTSAGTIMDEVISVVNGSIVSLDRAKEKK